MGVGYPEDLVACVSLGVDMFDCVYPTRTARFGTAFTSKGLIRVKNSDCRHDYTPLEQGCTCECC
jgi:tRNA-guanine family transglycosylase